MRKIRIDENFNLIEVYDILLESRGVIEGIEGLCETIYKYINTVLGDKGLKEQYKDRKTVFHSKIFITGKRNKEGKFILNNDSMIYIGSHNLSASAWGNYEKNGTQISVANYELGIIFDVNLLSFQEKLDIYNNLLFNFDAPKYTEEDAPFITENI